MRRSGSPTCSGLGSLAPVPLPSLIPHDRTFFVLFDEAGQNTVRAARLLRQMLGNWPEEAGLAREILLAEQEGDRITHDLVQQLGRPERVLPGLIEEVKEDAVARN